MNNINQWMCDLCYPNSVELGEVLPGYSLIKSKNEHHLLGGQGHSGDVLVSFEIEPFPDPDPDCNNESLEIQRLSDLWVDKILQPVSKLKLCPEEGYKMLKSAKKSGYDEQSGFSWWLANRIGEVSSQFF